MAFAVTGVGDVYCVAGGAGNFGDDGAFILEDGVDERGFAGIGTTDDCDFETFSLSDLGDFTHLFLQGSEMLVHEIGEGLHVASMLG